MAHHGEEFALGPLGGLGLYGEFFLQDHGVAKFGFTTPADDSVPGWP